MGSPQYIGIFLTPQSRRALLREHPPVHANVYADHVTLVYKPRPSDLEKVELGSLVKIQATRYYEDEKGQAVAIKLPPELARLANRQPHITISTAPGTPPVYSNKLIQGGGGERASQQYTGILDVPTRAHPVQTRRFPMAAGPSHYKIDQADVRRKTRRDKRSELEQAKDLGFYTYTVMKPVPISKIRVPSVWKESRIKRIREGIQQGKALPPVHLAEKGGRYEIEDGIHRTNASIEAGFTHVPAYLTVAVERPDLYEEAEPEKRKLSPGTWVKMRDPSDNKERFPWAVVLEYGGPRVWKGVRRHTYGLIGGKADAADFIGDFSDDAFDPVRKSEVPARVRENILNDPFARGLPKHACSDKLPSWSAPNKAVYVPFAPVGNAEDTTQARAVAQSRGVESRIRQRVSALTTITRGGPERVSSLKSYPAKRSVASTSAAGKAKSKGSVERITTRYAAKVRALASDAAGNHACSLIAPSFTTPRATASVTTTSGNATAIHDKPLAPSKDQGPSPKKGTESSRMTVNESLNIDWSCRRFLGAPSAKPSESTISMVNEQTTDRKILSFGFSPTPQGNAPKTRFTGPEKSSQSTALCSPIRVAVRWLQARDYFEIGDIVTYGKWKNLRGRIVGWGKDHKGNPTVEIEPIPKGRKKNKVMGLFKIWKQPAEKQASQWSVEDFFARHPKLRGYAGIKVRDKASGTSASHGEARQHGREIWLFPKFYKLDRKLQDWVLAHEIGHYVLSKYGTAAFIKLAYAAGVDPWDTPNLPYAQFNMDEAFADTFAAYFLNPGELKSRYPAWVGLVKSVVSKVRTADLSPPLGYPGGPCHVVQRIDKRVRSPKLEDKLIDLVESGVALSNPEASRVYKVETEKGPWKFERMNLTAHVQYRMDLRGITVPEVRMAINSFFRAYNTAKSKKQDRSAQAEAKKWEMDMMRRKPITWTDPKIGLTVVFTADARRYVLNVVTAYWKGQKDPPAPGTCRIAKAYERRVIREMLNK